MMMLPGISRSYARTVVAERGGVTDNKKEDTHMEIHEKEWASKGVAGAVLSKKASGMLEGYFPSTDGVDLYALKCELMKRIGDEPFPMSIGGIIDATFTKGDIEKLYGYIERA